MENFVKFRHNVMNVHSISAFESIRGGINQNCKDVYFVRFVGVCDTLAADVRRMDGDMAERMARGCVIYRRMPGLPSGFRPDCLADYEGFYREWLGSGREAVSTNVLSGCGEYAALLGRGIARVSALYARKKTVSASMEKNFVIKMLYWHDAVFEDVLRQWNLGQSIKIVLSNLAKHQEYLFACLLTFLGCDVLLLQSETDISREEEALGLSERVVLGAFGTAALPAFDPKAVLPKTAEIKEKPASPARSAEPAKPVSVPKEKPDTGRQEKSFEQLALLASSVVMIGIHDRKGDMIGTGSGIMIGADGYILTNSHVASGGSYYSVRIEEDETAYSTDELVKYHSVLDLAVLRIERRLVPLPVYRDSQKLVRGQKVVAIGSPLGLFNSVSDGIISGFRNMDGVDMIQFTAPTSHGSSGGALLNMYGEVIGISTAGFDNAQNINLAVGYESILPFIRGFT